MPIETREFYDHNMRTELDIIAQTDYAVRQGEARGKAEGKAEGRLESKVDIVMSLISRGYTEEDALEIVQATPEELEEICNRIHNP